MTKEANNNVQEVQEFLDNLFALRTNAPSSAEESAATDFEQALADFSFEQD